MCAIGPVLGIMSTAVGAAAKADAAQKNAQIIKQNTQLKYAAQEREFLVKANAANKEAYQAYLEGDRAKAFIAASGNGMEGATAGMRSAEQSRQSALSIENARDQREAARANYVSAGKGTQIEAQNAINAQTPSPITSFLTVVSGGLGGLSEGSGYGYQQQNSLLNSSSPKLNTKDDWGLGTFTWR